MKNLEITNCTGITRIELSGNLDLTDEVLRTTMVSLNEKLGDDCSLIIYIDKESSLNLSFTDKTIVTENKIWQQILCMAIVAEELPHRILANYLKRESRGRMQTKVFKERAEAERWMEVCV